MYSSHEPRSIMMPHRQAHEIARPQEESFLSSVKPLCLKSPAVTLGRTKNASHIEHG